MRRLVPGLLRAALPSTASAATFGELPFHPVAGGAKCRDAAGAPGELVRDTGTGTELLRATAAGLTPARAVTHAPFTTCSRAVYGQVTRRRPPPRMVCRDAYDGDAGDPEGGGAGDPALRASGTGARPRAVALGPGA